MHAPIPSPARRFALCHLALMCAAACALAACDRHDAQEVPESYGHGSAHADAQGRESYSDHHTDSTGEHHFSDTQGTENEPTPGPASVASPSPTGAGTPAGHFF